MIQKPYSYLQDYTTVEHYILKGIIYYNGNHFTARIIDKNLSIWYHDGCVKTSSIQS